MRLEEYLPTFEVLVLIYISMRILIHRRVIWTVPRRGCTEAGYVVSLKSDVGPTR